MGPSGLWTSSLAAGRRHTDFHHRLHYSDAHDSPGNKAFTARPTRLTANASRWAATTAYHVITRLKPGRHGGDIAVRA